MLPPPPQKKKKKNRLVLPYLGLQSKIIIKQLKACINIFYGCIDLRVIFPKHTSHQVSFPLQRQAQPFSNVQRASCCDCQDFYIGKTKRRLHDRKLNTSRQSSAIINPHFHISKVSNEKYSILVIDIIVLSCQCIHLPL